MTDNGGFYRGNRQSSDPNSKKEKQKQVPTPTSTPDPAVPIFTVDCFAAGARFAIATQATGPGPIGWALSGPSVPLTHLHLPAFAPNEGDVPDVLGLSERVTQSVSGVNVNNYQVVLDSLRKARDYMDHSATDSMELQNQDAVIECFENFCKKQNWPVFSVESH